MYISLNTSTSSSAIADISSAKMIVRDTGKLNLPAYGSGSFTGTETYFLAVTSGGDVVEADSSALPGGPYLPLTGGTLTGSLTGTTATFSGTSDGFITLNSTDNGSVFMSLKRSGTRISYIGYGDNSNNLMFVNETTNGHSLFSTNDTERMRLTSDGYLGLGVTSPNAIMQISGTSPSGRALHITDNKTSKSNGAYTLQVDSSAHTSNMSAAGAFNVEVNSGNAFTIAGNGNSTFGYNVTVGGTLYYNGNLRSVSPSKLILYNNSDKTEIHSAGSTGILFKDNSNIEKMRLTSGGNLGIGTASPQYLIDSSGTSATIRAVATSASNPSLILSSAGITAWSQTVSGTDSSFSFNKDGSEKMRLTSGGNLLIGTPTDTGEKLQVRDNTSSNNALLKLMQDGTGDACLGFNIVGSTQARIGLDNDDGDSFKISRGSNLGTNTQLTIPSTGNVLIGTTTDSGSKLKVEYAGGSPSGIIVKSTSNRSKISVADNNTIAYVIAEDSFASYGMQDNLSANNLNINNSGNVLIGTTTDSGFYKLDVNGKQRVQSVLELDDVLTLNAISTPSDPANNKSSIYMDSADGSIKVKINVGGTVVTRTIASFE